LQNEGFEWEKYLDIFDGGPTMTVKTDAIKSVREAQDSVIIEITNSIGDHIGGDKVLASRGTLRGFRASFAWIEQRSGGVAIDATNAAALGVAVGDQITHVPRW
jgi:arginine N-succinyltransferase